MRGMLSSATYKHRINLYNLICHENTHICKYRVANRLPPSVPHTDTHSHYAIWPGPVPPVGEFEECVVRNAHTSSSRLMFALIGTVGVYWANSRAGMQTQKHTRVITKQCCSNITLWLTHSVWSSVIRLRR